MARNDDQVAKMAELMFTLRQKCSLKDLHFVKRFGISSAEYNCLIQFYGMSSIGMKELGEHLSITPGGVTRIITSLEEKKLVKREIDPDDRRGINVNLTEQGERIVSDIRRASLELHNEILKQIKPDQHGAIVGAIEQLLGAIDTWLVTNSETELNG